MSIEKKLKSLFEFQKFENSSRLGKIISDTENRYASVLSDSDIENIAAAGEINSVDGNLHSGELDNPADDKYHPLGKA